MTYPYKLAASLEDVANWAKTSLPRIGFYDRRWSEGAFPVVSTDPDSGSLNVSPMFPGEKVDECPLQYVMSAGLLTKDSKAWDAFYRRRCLIPVSALRVERRNLEGVQKGFELRPIDEPLFALAGVWAGALTAEGDRIKVFRAITVHPSILLCDVFAELPVIVAQSDYSRWLGIQAGGSLPIDVLRPLSAVQMKRWMMLPEDKVRAHVEKGGYADLRHSSSTRDEKRRQK